MTTERNKQLHLLLTQCDLMAQKGNLIAGFTAGRTESSREMTDFEANQIINWLKTQLPGKGNEAERMNTMRRKIISMSYEMGWAAPGDWKAALLKINDFCTGSHGKFKKNLNELSYKELVHETTQFNQMYLKYLRTV